MERSQNGHTLVELVVVILIFSVVTTLITVSFNRIVGSASQVTKSAETDIGGIIGLELLRSDLESAGFGLPWSLPGGLQYQETPKDPSDSPMVSGYPGTLPSDFNDRPDDTPPSAPRAYISGDNVGYNGSDYLVLKGTAVGMNSTCRSWSYLNYSSVFVPKQSRSEVELTPGQGGRVVVIKNTVNKAGIMDRQLVTDGPGSAVFMAVFDGSISSNFLPKNREESYQVYGVSDGNTSSLSFPYNRADYFLSRPDDISKVCAKKTAVLYKALMPHNGIASVRYPLQDCVADLQVIFLMATNGDGIVDQHLSDLSRLAPGGKVSAEQLRDQLREIRVYILAQQGKKDPLYQYPLDQLPIVVGDAGMDKALGRTLGSSWNEAAMARLDPEWRHFHWKVYSIVVQPKNL
ncbi:type II secretion system protein [Geomonas sp.]|uniref:PulJ/GspJ family protein n=1 Tax=Geomonas sp. TaxID=2651584 RepID=UPI002B49384E|nr:type II secretion system protein [Geomonas sp.]HJV36912.1 type II secretion system protein [Geomonas sp.]